MNAPVVARAPTFAARRAASLALAGLACAACLACGERSDAPAAACGARDGAAPVRGAIVVVVDTLRADHVGLYGGGALTPRIDALGRDSLVFRNAYATASWTRPSVGSILTGRYPSAIGLRGRLDALPPDVETLAERLARRGVATFGIETNRNAGRAWGFARGFDAWHAPSERASYPGGFGMVPADAVTRAALDALDRALAARPDAPFFGYVHYVDPHDPYLPHASPEPAEPAAGRFDGSRRALESLDALPDAERTRDDEERVRALYRGEVRYVDGAIGALVDGLAARGVLDDALVVVTSDHGEGLWDHDLRAHGGELFEEQIRIPLVVKLPRGARASGVREDLASLVDVAPTLLAAFGVPAPADLPGRDLAACDAASGAARAVYAEIADHGRYFDALRTGDWKLVRNRIASPENRDRTERVVVGDNVWKIAWRSFGPDFPPQRIVDANPDRFPPGTRPEDAKLEPGERLRLPDVALPPGAREVELFDLRADPTERRDLSGDASRLAPLLDAIDALRAGIDARAVAPAAPEPPPARAVDDLRALGYLE